MTHIDEIYTDWVLMAVVYGGERKRANIGSIISAADYVNHAIITFDKLSVGIKHLLQNKIIYRKGSYFKLSKRIANRYDSTHSNNSATYWKVTKEIVAECKYKKDDQLFNTNGEINRSEYERAVRDYLERNKVE